MTLLFHTNIFDSSKYYHLSVTSNITTLMGSPLTILLKIPSSITPHCTKLHFPQWSCQYLKYIVFICLFCSFSHYFRSFMTGRTCPYYSCLFLSSNDSLSHSRLLNKSLKTTFMQKYISHDRQNI